MRRPRFIIYRDSRGEFRWRLKAANGRVIADGAEGYKTKRGCLNGMDAFFQADAHDYEDLT